MKPLDYILIVVIASVIAVAIFFTIKNARSGKGCGGCGGCGGNCSSCPYKTHIKKGEKKETDKENDKNNK